MLYVSTGTHVWGGQKKAQEPLEVELQKVVSGLR